MNNWERIESVIRWANMTINYFAHHIGLARGENLYQIKRGNNGISRDLADRIVAKFPQIDKLWLLTGEGEMFAIPKLRSAQIPFYREDVSEGLDRVDKLESECRMLVPQIGPCDLAMRYLGREMGMMTPPGTTVILKRVDPEAIIPGREYAIVSPKIVTLRIVRTTDRPGVVRLVAGDTDHFDEIVMNINEISAIYEVKAKLVVNN